MSFKTTFKLLFKILVTTRHSSGDPPGGELSILFIRDMPNKGEKCNLNDKELNFLFFRF